MSLNIKEVVEYIDSTTRIMEAQEKALLEKKSEIESLKKQASETAVLFGVDSLDKVREKVASLSTKTESKVKTWGSPVGDEMKVVLGHKEAAERKLCERLGIPYKRPNT